MKPHSAVKSLQLCPTLCDPINGSPPGSPNPGVLQARTLEWVAISFSNAWKWKVKGSCSVMSDSLWPHGLQPTRLLRPWDFLGKNAGVGCHKPHATPAHISRTKSETIWRKEMGVGVQLYFLQRKLNICFCSFTGSRLSSIKTSKFPWMNLCSLESPLHLLHRNQVTLNQLNAVSSFPPPSSPSPYLTRVVQPW